MKPAYFTLFLLVLLGAAPTTQPLPPVTINRSDFVAAALRFEEAYAAHPPQPGENRARIHRAFDEAIYLNLTNRSTESIERLNQLSDALDPATGNPAIRSLIRSLQVRVNPQIAWRTRPGIFRARIVRMYRTSTPLPVELRLVIRADTTDKKVILDEPVKIEDSGPPFSLTRAGPEAPLGRYIVELVGPDKVAHPVDRWTMVEVSQDVIRQGIASQIVIQRPESADMTDALVALGTRSALLTDRPDLNSSAFFLPEPLDLVQAVRSEMESFLLGKDPYADKTGDWWRAIQAGAMQVPSRIYAPSIAKSRRPMPLVIALQGGQWDESTFMEAVGRGRIKALAEREGFVVVSPSAYWLKNNLAAFDAIVASMSLHYAIDKSRVYVLGNSSGAAVASQTAGRNAHKVAAVALISGSDFNGLTKLPRTRLYSGGVDPFFPPDQAKTSYDAAHKAGLPVELRSAPDSGHLLLADDVLEEAIMWMLNGGSNAAPPGTSPVATPASPAAPQ